MSRRIHKAADGERELYDGFNDWSATVASYGRQAAYAIIAANWVINCSVTNSPEALLSNPWAKWSMVVTILYIGINLWCAWLMANRYKVQLDYAEADENRWENEFSEYKEKSWRNPWPYTKSIESLGVWFRWVNLSGPVMGGLLLIFGIIFGPSPDENGKNGSTSGHTCYSSPKKNSDSDLLGAIKENTVHLDSIAIAIRNIQVSQKIMNNGALCETCCSSTTKKDITRLTDALKDNSAHLDSIATAIRKISIAPTNPHFERSGILSFVCILAIAVLSCLAVWLIFRYERKWWKRILLLLSLGGLTIMDSLALKVAEAANFKIADTINYKPTKIVDIHNCGDTLSESGSPFFRKEAQLTGFKDADTVLASDTALLRFMADTKKICEMADNESLVSVWIIGSADKRNLRAPVARKFSSNMNLAMLRGETVMQLLLKQTAWEKRKSLAAKILIIPAGALHVGTDVDTLLMAADRSVSVYAIWNLKK